MIALAERDLLGPGKCSFWKLRGDLDGALNEPRKRHNLSTFFLKVEMPKSSSNATGPQSVVGRRHNEVKCLKNGWT